MPNSKNPSSADNQQERLAGWIIGFVDGEGCFSVGFIKQQNRTGRKGYKLGVQVRCEFVVTQGEKSLSALKKLEKFFKVGSIYVNKRYDNHKEHLYRYCVRRRADLRSVIIPFFKANTLHTSKEHDFKLFCDCFDLIEQGEHLKVSGLYKINAISSKMNHQKDRSYILPESSTTIRAA